MSKRHSWAKKINGAVNVAKPTRTSARKIMRLDNVRECEYCGLMKGVQKGGSYIRWHNTIYFKDGEFLSEEKIPYTCTGKQVDFLTKEDFYV